MPLRFARFWTALALGCDLLLAFQKPAAADDSHAFTWGRVLDADTGKPLTGIRLIDPTTGTSWITDDTGTFFASGTVTRLQIMLEGYQSQTFQFPGPSLTARHPDGSGDGRLLRDTGFVLRLRRQPPAEAPLAVLPSQVTLSWRPDALWEQHTGTNGTAFTGSSLRPSSAWLDATVHLGPTLLSGSYGSQWYQIQHSTSDTRLGRWQHQGTIALSYVHHWHPRLVATIGPAAVLQQISLLGATSPQSQPQADPDVASTRWGAGLNASLTVQPWQAVPITVDTRLGLFPVTWQLTDTVTFTPRGLWSMQGSVGLRWFPITGLGIDLRYFYDHWQTATYYQGSHGTALGGMILF